MNGLPDTNVETMCEGSSGSVAASVTRYVLPGSSGSENGTRTPACAAVTAKRAQMKTAERESVRLFMPFSLAVHPALSN